jgi:hypothetical protein
MMTRTEADDILEAARVIVLSGPRALEVGEVVEVYALGRYGVKLPGGGYVVLDRNEFEAWS